MTSVTNLAAWSIGPKFYRKQDDEALRCVDCNAEVGPEKFCFDCGEPLCCSKSDSLCQACRKDAVPCRRLG
jgi:hypothetical protein